MRRIALVMMKHVKDYFPSPNWRSQITEDGEFIAKDINDIAVKLDPSHVMYSVSMTAEDDPSDTMHEITDKPLDAITDFLGAGIPGGHVFKQKATVGPDAYSALLRRMAARIGHVSRPAKLIRRVMILPNLDLFSDMISRYAAANPADFRMEERILNNFRDEAKQKGWKFEITDDEPPKLHASVHGFDIDVDVDSIMWDYQFELEGYPESKEAGQIEDPLEEFRQWRYYSDKFQKAAEQANRDIEGEDKISTEEPEK